MNNTLPFYTAKQAAERLGVSYGTLTKLARDGDINVSGKAGANYIFTEGDIEDCQRKYFNPGYTHTEIAAIYGKERTAVIYYFVERLRVKPSGKLNSRRGALTYDPLTVEKMAKALKWEPVMPQDQIDALRFRTRAS